jgi:Domain of unknown function (DUF4296)
MRIAFFGVVLCVLIACGNSKKLPDGIIPKAEMEKVLWDMILADRFAAQYIAKDSTKLDVKKETFREYDKVFQVHNITQEQFLKSYKFYMSRPDISKVMFDSLSSKGNRNREESYDKFKK